jgi:thioredoxin-related protein
MKKIFSIIICTIFLSAIAIGQEGIEFNKGDWNSILAEAEKENKLVFVDAYTVWCGPCKKMARDVFPQKKVGDFFNEKFINVQIDMEKGEGLSFAEKYNVQVYPTLLFVAGDGSLVHRSAGYKDSPDFIELGNAALDPLKRISSLKERFENGDRDPEFLKNYTAILYDAYDGSHIPIAEAYLKTQENWNSDENLVFIFQYVNDANSELFNHIAENQDLYIEKIGQIEVSSKFQSLIISSINESADNSSLEQIDALYAKIYPDRAKQLSAAFRLTYYRQAGDRDNFTKSAIQYYKDFPSEDPGELNDIAWTFYTIVEDKKQLKQAVKWAKKSVKIDNNFYNNDTLAALYSKIGKKKKAIKAANQAIYIAKELGEDYSETQQLLDEIHKM